MTDTTTLTDVIEDVLAEGINDIGELEQVLADPGFQDAVALIGQLTGGDMSKARREAEGLAAAINGSGPHGLQRFLDARQQ